MRNNSASLGMDAQEQTRKPYPSDLSESQWLLIAPLLPSSGSGRTRTTDLREVLNAVLYLFRTGRGWRHLPHDFPTEGTVRDSFHQWRRAGVWQTIHFQLRRAVRVQEGHDPEPRAAIIANLGQLSLNPRLPLSNSWGPLHRRLEIRDW